MKYRAIIVVIVITALPMDSALGQFYGGNGDGNVKTNSVQLTLDGLPVNTAGLYQGGIGEGSDKRSVSTLLSGQELSGLYLGGSGDGAEKNQVATSLDGVVLDVLYFGGSGDGHDRDEVTVTLDGLVLDVIYAGGVGDGHNKIVFNGLLDGVKLDGIYTGGIGDGHGKIEFNGTLTGDQLQVLYTGGIGDGHDKTAFNGVLDGTNLQVLYGGGDGDGFTKRSFEFIIDFPDCTFVVNTDDDGYGSLRYAIDCASSGDTISFSPLLVDQSIDLISGPLSINKDLVINGNPTTNLSVDGTQVTNTILAGLSGMTDLKIKGLDLIGGSQLTGSAISNGSNLTLEDLSISNSGNNTVSVVASFNGGTITIEGVVRLQNN